MNYKIVGEPLPAVICDLQPGEALITESGAMSWMTANMKMDTSAHGGIGKAFGRAFSGESMFMNLYTCTAGQGLIVFSSSLPGRILPFQIGPGANIIAQKRSFLCAESGVELSVHFNRKIGAGFFGGEGFIMQRLSGQGLAFLELDGHVVEYDLQPGQTMVIDSGNLAAMTDTVKMDIESTGSVKNMFLGGEGFFNTRVTGPGHIWLQTMPASRLAASLHIGAK